MSRVVISGEGIVRKTEAAEGANLLEVMRAAGIPAAAPCGGMGKCKKCRVTITDAIGTREALACRTTVAGDCRVAVDGWTGGSICTAAEDEESIAPGRNGYGAAVDIGTTTVAVRVFDLCSGEEIGSGSGWNAQLAYGADVISRIHHIMKHEDGLLTLGDLIRAQVSGLIDGIAIEHGMDPQLVDEAFIAGNTIMQHIFAGYSPVSIARAPFTPHTLFESGQHTRSFGRRILFAPCVSGFVGGDITAGLLFCGAHRNSGLSLFVDVGTNGEMALGSSAGFACCSVASGPAFEGAGISCGMTSTQGAINRFWLERGSPRFDVIGGGSPKGICGTGLLDIIAELVRAGAIDESGRLLPPDDVPEELLPHIDEDRNGNGIFYIDRQHGIALTASDVRQAQLAKAAVAAGIDVLLNETGTLPDEIGSLYIAGGFGLHLDIDSAVGIGMFPQKLRDRILPLGNSSLSGARLALLSEEWREELSHIRRMCSYIELSGHPRFNEAFADNMYF